MKKALTILLGIFILICHVGSILLFSFLVVHALTMAPVTLFTFMGIPLFFLAAMSAVKNLFRDSKRVYKFIRGGING